jgi:hypothetical protein
MDIVERLLMPIQWCAVTSATPTTTFSIAAQEDYNVERREAAGEIERLRAIADTDTPELLEQQAEIRRLRADNAEWQDRCLRYQTALQEMVVACHDVGVIARRALSNNLDTKPDSA